MFNVGGGELIVILLIALIVLGPSRLPDAARTIGKTMGELRRLSSSFQNEVKSALDTADDTSQVASRRNPLAKEGAEAPEQPDAPDAHPRRTQPLVAGPAPEGAPPTEERAPTKPPAVTKPATTKATTAKKAKPANGTAVAKPTAAKTTPRRTKPS